MGAKIYVNKQGRRYFKFKTKKVFLDAFVSSAEARKFYSYLVKADKKKRRLRKRRAPRATKPRAVAVASVVNNLAPIEAGTRPAKQSEDAEFLSKVTLDRLNEMTPEVQQVIQNQVQQQIGDPVDILPPRRPRARAQSLELEEKASEIPLKPLVPPRMKLRPKADEGIVLMPRVQPAERSADIGSLRIVADEKGIAYDSKTSKDQLLGKIRKHDHEKQAQPASPRAAAAHIPIENMTENQLFALATKHSLAHSAKAGKAEMLSILRRAGIKGSGRSEGGLYDDQIEKVMKIYPQFAGVIASDEVNRLNAFIDHHKQVGFVINLDPHEKAGSHWCAVYIDSREPTRQVVEWYNPFGDAIPPLILREIKQVLLDHRGVFKLKENRVKQQSDTSNNCGFFAQRFLMDRFAGKTFAQATGFDDHLHHSAVAKNEAEIERMKQMPPFKWIV